MGYRKYNWSEIIPICEKMIIENPLITENEIIKELNKMNKDVKINRQGLEWHRKNHVFDGTFNEWKADLLGFVNQNKGTGSNKIAISQKLDMLVQRPKILLFDIETSPYEFYGFRTGKQYIRHHQIKKHSAMLSWAGKWLCEGEVFSDVVNIKDARNRKDKKIVKSLWKVLDEADILIAHNLKGFDLKYFNTRAWYNNFKAPSPVQLIDTLEASRKNFLMPSHSLDFLTKFLELQEKLETDFSLWKRCVTGDKSALDEMSQYNKHDIFALEDLYLKMRGWIKGHVNIGMYYDDIQDRCPNCGNTELKDGGKYYTPAGRFVAKQCQSCGAYGRYGYSDLTRTERKNILRALAR